MPERSNHNLPIVGRVIDGRGRGLGNVRVVAVDASEQTSTPTVVLTATTDSKGQFELEVPTADVLRLFRTAVAHEARRTRPLSSGSVRLSFSAMSCGRVVGRSDLTMTLDGLVAGYDVEIREDDASDGDTTSFSDFVVVGLVSTHQGVPLRGARVEVVRQQLRDETVLARTTVGADGSYRLSYKPPEADGGFALFVRVSEVVEGRRSGEVGRSARVCPVPTALELNVDVGVVRNVSEYVLVATACRRELGSVHIADLGTDDVEYIVCVTRLPVDHVITYVRAAQLSASTHVPDVALYALGRTGIPLSVAAVGALERSLVATQLTRAAATNIVPEWGDGEVENLAEQLVSLVRARAVGDGSDAPLGNVFAIAGVEPAVRQRFLSQYVERTGTVAEFWTSFRRDEGTRVTETIQFSLQTAALAADHGPMVEHLQRLRRMGTVRSTRELTAFTRERW
ncbi:MAG: hypothetical protein JKY37_17305 [Nannocystaceae bacterium]|nr:hypothetical protein [Nannocystaceae bacterium]